MALIVRPMLESWVPGHLSRVVPTYEQKKQQKATMQKLQEIHICGDYWENTY